MWRSSCVKGLLAGTFLLLSSIAWSQEVLKNVRIQKLSSTQYRVRYQLSQAQRVDLDTLMLRIYRRRDGKVEEVFVSPLRIPAGSGHFSYDWKTDTGTVKTGDELQARIQASYNKPVVARSNRPGANLLPQVSAGPFQEVALPLKTPITLRGSVSDSDGKVVSVHWKLIGGPSLVEVNSPNAPVTTISGDIREGRYTFEITARDDKGGVSSDRVLVTVRAAAPPVAQQPVDPARNDTAARIPSPPTRTKLKGGPSNAVVNILLPGLGHYYVSGDHHGRNRKAGLFGITALYLGSAGGAYYFKDLGDRKYKEYLDIYKSREYQYDGSGNVIGERGVNQPRSAQLLKEANDARKNALILGGVAAGILTADLVLTLRKGFKNRSAWEAERRGTTRVFVTSDGMTLAAGIRIKL